MKAVIMAGGKGTRGKPYTEYFPKAMTPIYGKPLIDYIVRYIRSFDLVDQIVIITDVAGMGGQIRNYYGDSVHSKRGGIVFVQDSQSGTGGDLLHVANMIPDNEPFILWFADNLCAVDLKGMRKQFEACGSTACIATRRERAEETGFAAVDENGIVKKFIEKPVIKLPSPECLGVYMLGREVFARIEDAARIRKGYGNKGAECKTGGKGADPIGKAATDGNDAKDCSGSGVTPEDIQVNLSHDILQDLAGEGAVSAFDIGDSQWIDAESPVTLERNKTRVNQIINAMRTAIGDHPRDAR